MLPILSGETEINVGVAEVLISTDVTVIAAFKSFFAGKPSERSTALSKIAPLRTRMS